MLVRFQSSFDGNREPYATVNVTVVIALLKKASATVTGCISPSPLYEICIGKSEVVPPPAIPTRYAMRCCNALRVGDETCA